MALFTNQMRFTGMSGLDTQDIVTQLMRAHSMRLDRMRQNRDILRWQQDMMRSVASDMTAFRNNFVGTTMDHRNITRPANFSGFTATATMTNAAGQTVNAPGVSVSVREGASPGNGTTNINVVSPARGDVFRGSVMNNGIVGADFSTDTSLASIRNSFMPKLEAVRFDSAGVTTRTVGGNTHYYFGGARAVRQGDYLYAADADGNLATNATHPAGARLQREVAANNFGFRVTVNGTTQTINVARDVMFNAVRAPGTGTFGDPDYVSGPIIGWVNRHANEQGFADAVLTEINQQLDTRFGRDTLGDLNTQTAPGMNNRQRVFAYLDNDGNLVIKSRGNHDVRIADGLSHSQGTLGNLGLSAGSTSFNLNMSMEDLMGSPADLSNMNFTIGRAGSAVTFAVYNGYLTATRADGSDINLGAAGNTPVDEMSVNDFMALVNSQSAHTGARLSFNNTSGRFTMESTAVGVANAINFDGDFFDRLGMSLTDRQHTTIASQAIIEIDSIPHERDSNNFTIGDLSFRLDPSSMGEIPPGGLQVAVTTSRDTEQTMTMIREFVEAYNSLIRSIRDLTETRRPRVRGGRDFYMPLTDEQRRAMSDREVEMWEAQARTGILHRDDTLRRLTQEIHREVFRNVRVGDQIPGSNPPRWETINLVHVGIRTSSSLDEFGELQIDEDRLRSALENNLEGVTELFTRQNFSLGVQNRPERLRDSGIGQRIGDLLNWQLTAGGGIHDRAGLDRGLSQHDNDLSRRIGREDRRIEDMIQNLQRREQRYFLTFGRLEAAMMQSQSQMMFLEQMFWMG